mgnify:CR=1 FL=1
MTKFKNIVFTLVALVISVTGISARPLNRANSFLAKQTFSVIFIGSEGAYLLFQVIVNANNTNDTSFVILDKAAGANYTANINFTHNVQTLKIEKRDNQELDFKLVIGKDVYSRSFAIL